MVEGLMFGVAAAADFRRVHFRKGRNRLLVRVENGHWNCGWSVCISTADSKPAK